MKPIAVLCASPRHFAIFIAQFDLATPGGRAGMGRATLPGGVVLQGVWNIDGADRLRGVEIGAVMRLDGWQSMQGAPYDIEARVLERVRP